MKKMLSFNNKNLIIYFFIMLLSLFSFLILKEQVKHINIYLIVSFTVLIVEGLILFYLMQENKLKIEKIFLLMATFLGFLYMIFIPLNAVPDEYGHFYRAYTISEGQLISKKNNRDENADYVPKSAAHIYSGYNLSSSFDYFDDLSDELNYEHEHKNETVAVDMAGQALFSPVCYIPQAIGILIGRILHFPMLLIAYFCRLVNFTVWLLVTYFSIKRLHSNKFVFLMLILLPMGIQQAASCSADALTNSVCFAFITYILHLIETKNKISTKSFVLVSTMAIIISMCKIVYLPLCLMLFLIPKECFKNKKDKMIKIIGLLSFVTILNLIWLKISSQFLFQALPGVNEQEQIKFIFTNPFQYLFILLNTIQSNGLNYLLNYSSIASYNIELSSFYFAIYYFIIFYVMIFDSFNKNITKKIKYILTFILLSCSLLIFTSIFIQWNPVGNNIIEGIQGRYFIPLLPLFALLFSRDRKNKGFQLSNIMIYGSILVFNIYTLANVLQFYL